MHLHGIPNGQPSRAFDVNSKAKSGSKMGDEESRTPDRPTTRTDTGHTRSAEVVRLAEQLGRIPETRERLVQQAMERYASGYYLTQEAAELTADRLTGNKSSD